MLGTKARKTEATTPDPVEAQRKALAEAEAALEKARTELAEWEKDRERELGEYEAYKRSLSETQSPVAFSVAWPSTAAARSRGLQGAQLRDAARAAEERVKLERERLERAEQTMAPLSSAARARLEELVGWVTVDREIEDRLGADPCALIASGRGDELVEFARQHGVEAGGSR